jgi:mannose-6-phosphate isomerase-like protein (cupin superfamily)
MENKVIDKPWGSEELLSLNDKYCMKLLKMNPDERCSLQYHQHKHETVYCISGILIVSHVPNFDANDLNNTITMWNDVLSGKLNKIVELYPGDYIVIPVGMIHQMIVPADQQQATQYLEASTPELDDVIRLKDAYGRITDDLFIPYSNERI